MEQNKKEPVKGIRIRTINLLMILLSCILYVLLITVTIRISKEYEGVHDSMDDYIACEASGDLLTEGSAYLTEQVRLYVITAERRYMDNYFTEVHVTRRRETALDQMREYYGEKEYQYLAGALKNSNDLMEREIYAMRLVAEAGGEAAEDLPSEVREVRLTEEDLALLPEEMVKKAQSLVFGDSYQEAKDQIAGDVEESLSGVHEATHERMLSCAGELKSTMARQGGLISVLFVENIIIFILILLLIIRPLQIYIRCIREDRMMEITGSYEFKYLALTYNDIYEVNTANEAMLRYQAEHDPLTGIINRGAFEQLKELLRIRPIPLALLIVDVDKFKQVNDGYGHETGDKVLKKVAELLQEGFRATDYPARIGGDEFAVILTNMTEKQSQVIERKIGEMNDALTHPQDGLPVVSLSVGAAFSEQGFTDDLYRRADLALYEVKEHGRCGCRFYREKEE